MCEVAQSTGLYNIVEHLDVGKVLLTIECRTTESLTAKDNLVFLQVGLLQNNLNAVRELKFCISELIVLCLLLNRALLWHCCHQGLVLYVVYVCLNLSCTCGSDSLLHTILCRINCSLFFVVEVQYYQIAIFLRYKLLSYLVDCLDRNNGDNLLHSLVSIVNTWDRIVVDEVLNILVYKLAVETLVLVRVLLVKIAGEVSLEAVVLCRCKSKLSSSASLSEYCCERSLCLPFLWQETKLKCVNSI